MFCPNCGEEIIEQDQKFCQNCGSEIPTTGEVPQRITVSPKPTPVAQKYSVPKPVSTPTYVRTAPTRGGPGPASKKCLAFALVSLAIAIFTFGSAGGSGYGPFSFYIAGAIPRIIIVIIAHIVGLVFGIVSRTNSREASMTEPINGVEKAGSVFAIFGIVVNSIGLAIALIFAFVSWIPYYFFNPFY
ncbi:MAG: zinc-ribbon domain-containing protein [Promethearchaeota archaeon]